MFFESHLCSCFSLFLREGGERSLAMKFEINIMDTEVFKEYNHSGRYGYICRVSKKASKISPRKCAVWFAKNHRLYRTRRFIMVTETRDDARILALHFRHDKSFTGIPIRRFDAPEAKTCFSEQCVNKLHALVVM